jgi:hypothetical protein
MGDYVAQLCDDPGLLAQFNFRHHHLRPRHTSVVWRKVENEVVSGYAQRVNSGEGYFTSHVSFVRSNSWKL